MSTEKYEKEIKKIAKMIFESKFAIILSGAGISTESGIPDFRGPDGLWTKLGDDPMDVASIASFRRMSLMGASDDMMNMITSLVQTLITARPNKAHKAIGKLYKKGYIKACITQNIDGLHQRGGCKEVVEVHGTYKTATCQNCFKKYTFEFLVQKVLEDGQFPPSCDCQGIIKPDAIFFGESLPKHALYQAMSYSNKTDLMIVVGSSLVVYPIAEAPSIAKSNNAKLVIINLEPTPYDSQADVLIRGKLGEILPKILEEVENLEKQEADIKTKT
ncbi:MAG: NAD-dependent deacylase [Candidatus Lokiarchaeota archaeon]|nr:NAD-dependent deacylase [Candidatus Lokiarchaeota archaeon]